jgi:hypothetical protein
MSSSSPPGTTAIGARSPYSVRSVPALVTVACRTANRSPARSNSCRSVRTHASTTDGADSTALSSTVPAPVTSASAPPTAGFRSSTTIRRSARSRRASSVVSSVCTSSSSTHTSARAPAMPAACSVSGIRALAAR